MSPLHLPPEIIEQIIDHLHDDRETLKSFCLVSKLFVPRTQKYLFEDITINNFWKLKQWSGTFPDPKKSPAYHTRSLAFCCPEYITTGDSECGLIQSFANITRLVVFSQSHPYSPMGLNNPLEPFHNLSLVKSLCVFYSYLPSLKIIMLICSLPLLEDLEIEHVFGDMEVINGWKDTSQALTSPPLNGTLTIRQSEMNNIAHLLLALECGLHFQKIVWKAYQPKGLTQVIVHLVEACSDTLECIYIEGVHDGEPYSFGPCKRCNF